MRHILMAAAIAAVGFAASGPALAQMGPQPSYQPGGPAQVNGWCKVVTDHYLGSQLYGFYRPCAGPAMAYAPGTAHHNRWMQDRR